MDTNKQVKISFETKEDAIKYAEKNNISFNVMEAKKRKIILKSYSDNFTKN